MKRFRERTSVISFRNSWLTAHFIMKRLVPRIQATFSVAYFRRWIDWMSTYPLRYLWRSVAIPCV